jgi:3-deoxy-D-manno-octulosonic-acid transferase
MPRRRAPIRSWTGGEGPHVAERPPLSFAAYRGLTSAATPLAPLWLGYRLRQHKEHPERLCERYGRATRARPPGPLVWMHAASVGEMLSIVPLIERLRTEHLNVLVTSGTLTSAWLAGQRLPGGVIHQFVPLDMPRFVIRFLDHWRPDLGMFVESDLWPNIIMAASGRGIPLALVNGKLSERSFTRWRKTPRMISALLRRFDLCLTQSDADAARYRELGAARVIMTGNLKLDVPPPSAEPARLAELQAATAGRLVVAAASTHPGEEESIIEAHRRLKQIFPALLTIVAPRHPERGPAVRDLVRTAGLHVALRSRNELPLPTTDIYVADTLGELGILYRIAAIVLMGGSLVQHGGQNPIEAAKLGAAILHGPHVWNFADIYSTLDRAGAAEQVSDAGNLAARMEMLLKNKQARQAAADAAFKTVEALTGALERTLAALEPHLLKLRLERPSSHA